MKIQNHLSFILQLGGHLKFIRPLKIELQNIVLKFVLSRRKLKEDKEEIEEQRRLRQEEEEGSLVTVGSQFIL